MAVNIEIRADSRQFNRDISQVSNRIKKLTSDAGRPSSLNVDTRKAVNNINNLDRSLMKVSQTTAGIDKNVSRLTRAFQGMAIAAGGAFSGFAAANAGDSIQNISNLLRASGVEAANLRDELRFVAEAANATRSDFAATGQLVARMRRATGELGASTEEVRKATIAIQQGFQLSGASAQEASNAVIQLSQGLASGALRGDELRSVLEQAPVISQAIAKELGVSIGKLRELGAEGKITSEQVFRALLNDAENLDKLFKQMTPTFSQSWRVFSNGLTLAVGETTNLIGAALGVNDVLQSWGRSLTAAFTNRRIKFFFDDISLAVARLEDRWANIKDAFSAVLKPNIKLPNLSFKDIFRNWDDSSEIPEVHTGNMFVNFERDIRIAFNNAQEYISGFSFDLSGIKASVSDLKIFDGFRSSVETAWDNVVSDLNEYIKLKGLDAKFEELKSIDVSIDLLPEIDVQAFVQRIKDALPTFSIRDLFKGGQGKTDPVTAVEELSLSFSVLPTMDLAAFNQDAVAAADILQKQLNNIKIPELANIAQELQNVYANIDLPTLDELKQTITITYTNLEPPSLEEVSRIIRVTYEGLHLPSFEEITRTIKVAYQGLEIPSFSEMTRTIKVAYEGLDVPSLGELTQSVKLVFEKMSIRDIVPETIQAKVGLSVDEASTINPWFRDNTVKKNVLVSTVTWPSPLLPKEITALASYGLVISRIVFPGKFLLPKALTAITAIVTAIDWRSIGGDKEITLGANATITNQEALTKQISDAISNAFMQATGLEALPTIKLPSSADITQFGENLRTDIDAAIAGIGDFFVKLTPDLSGFSDAVNTSVGALGDFLLGFAPDINVHKLNLMLVSALALGPGKVFKTGIKLAFAGLALDAGVIELEARSLGEGIGAFIADGVSFAFSKLNPFSGIGDMFDASTEIPEAAFEFKLGKENLFENFIGVFQGFGQGILDGMFGDGTFESSLVTTIVGAFAAAGIAAAASEKVRKAFGKIHKTIRDSVKSGSTGGVQTTAQKGRGAIETIGRVTDVGKIVGGVGGAIAGAEIGELVSDSLGLEDGGWADLGIEIGFAISGGILAEMAVTALGAKMITAVKGIVVAMEMDAALAGAASKAGKTIGTTIQAGLLLGLTVGLSVAVSEALDGLISNAVNKIDQFFSGEDAPAQSIRRTEEALSSDNAGQILAEQIDAGRIDLDLLPNDQLMRVADELAKTDEHWADFGDGIWKIVTGQSSLEVSIDNLRKEMEKRKLDAPATFVSEKASGGPIFRATGGVAGKVLGAGTGYDDKIPAMLSNGEYVVRQSAVQKLGVNTLDKINRGELPEFAMRSEGGMVGQKPKSLLGDDHPPIKRAVGGIVGEEPKSLGVPTVQSEVVNVKSISEEDRPSYFGRIIAKELPVYDVIADTTVSGYNAAKRIAFGLEAEDIKLPFFDSGMFDFSEHKLTSISLPLMSEVIPPAMSAKKNSGELREGFAPTLNASFEEVSKSMKDQFGHDKKVRIYQPKIKEKGKDGQSWLDMLKGVFSGPNASEYITSGFENVVGGKLQASFEDVSTSMRDQFGHDKEVRVFKPKAKEPKTEGSWIDMITSVFGGPNAAEYLTGGFENLIDNNKKLKAMSEPSEIPTVKGLFDIFKKKKDPDIQRSEDALLYDLQYYKDIEKTGTYLDEVFVPEARVVSKGITTSEDLEPYSFPKPVDLPDIMQTETLGGIVTSPVKYVDELGEQLNSLSSFVYQPIQPDFEPTEKYERLFKEEHAGFLSDFAAYIFELSGNAVTIDMVGDRQWMEGFSWTSVTDTLGSLFKKQRTVNDFWERVTEREQAGQAAEGLNAFIQENYGVKSTALTSQVDNYISQVSSAFEQRGAEFSVDREAYRPADNGYFSYYIPAGMSQGHAALALASFATPDPYDFIGSYSIALHEIGHAFSFLQNTADMTDFATRAKWFAEMAEEPESRLLEETGANIFARDNLLTGIDDRVAETLRGSQGSYVYTLGMGQMSMDYFADLVKNKPEILSVMSVDGTLDEIAMSLSAAAYKYDWENMVRASGITVDSEWSDAELELATIEAIAPMLLKNLKEAFGADFDVVYGHAEGGPITDVATPMYKFNTGGHVSGPGTTTSDSIPAMLSNGEYVVKASSVKKLGMSALDSINKGVLPSKNIDSAMADPVMRARGGIVGSYSGGGMVSQAIMQGNSPQKFQEGGLAKSMQQATEVATIITDKGDKATQEQTVVLKRIQELQQRANEVTREDGAEAKEIARQLQQLITEAGQAGVTDASGKAVGGATGKKRETFFDSLHKTAEELEDFGINTANNFVSNFKSGLSAVFQGKMSEKDFLGSVLDNFTTNIINSVVDGFTNNLFKNSGLDKVFSGSNAFGQTFAGQGFQNIGQGTLGGPNQMGMDKNGQMMVNLNPDSKGIITDAMKQGSNSMTGVFGGFSQTLSGLFGGFQNGLGSIFNGITGMFSGGGGAGGGISGLLSGLTGGIGSILGGFGSLFGGGLGGMGALFGLPFASGGQVDGPGTGTSDSISARLSKGEYVIKARMVNKFGTGFFDQLNNGLTPNMPAFAEGGLVDMPSQASPDMANFGNVSNSSANSSTVNVTQNINITGDVSQQTRKTIAGMMPELAAGVRREFNESNVRFK